MSLKMRRIDLEGRSAADHVDVTVEPSNKVGDGVDGVYVGVNDHYAVSESDVVRSEPVVALLEENFETSLATSDALIDHVMLLAK